VLLAGVAILSVSLVGVTLGVLHLRRMSLAGTGPTGPGWLDLGPMRELLARGKWDEVLREGERLRVEHGAVGHSEREVRARKGRAHAPHRSTAGTKLYAQAKATATALEVDALPGLSADERETLHSLLRRVYSHPRGGTDTEALG